MQFRQFLHAGMIGAVSIMSISATLPAIADPVAPASTVSQKSANALDRLERVRTPVVAQDHYDEGREHHGWGHHHHHHDDWGYHHHHHHHHDM